MPRLIAKVALIASVWISYYSSHGGKTSIYLATIRFKNFCGRPYDAPLTT